MRDDAHLQIPRELIAQVRLSTGGQAHHCDYDLGLRIVWFGNLTVGSGSVGGGRGDERGAPLPPIPTTDLGVEYPHLLEELDRSNCFSLGYH